MQLDIVTPERKVYSKDVEMVIARAEEGDIGVLPNHAPLVSPLKISAVRVKLQDGEEWIAVNGGFIEVRAQQITILAESAELPTEIDVDRAHLAKKRAEDRIASNGDDGDDLLRAELALYRAVNRLKVAEYR